MCDEDLFDHTLDYFNDLHQKNRPFFSMIMTTSNHKPFTFPAGIPGVPARDGGRKAGVRYADYALGRFLDQASQHPWSGNTLFVIVADHDARVYGRAQIPLRHYRIPLLIYAPGKVNPDTVETRTSQMDIAPTVLGLLGLFYRAPFYGRDVLQVRGGEDHGVLLSHNLDVALYQGSTLTVLGMDRRHKAFRYDVKRDLLAPAEEDPILTDLATAYYQTAFDLFESHRYE